jgi:hypothetical protein
MRKKPFSFIKVALERSSLAAALPRHTRHLAQQEPFLVRGTA